MNKNFNFLYTFASLYKLYKYYNIIVTGGNVENSIELTESYMVKKYLTSLLAKLRTHGLIAT